MIDRRYESGKSFVMYSKEELEAAQRTDMVTFLAVSYTHLTLPTT